MKTIRTPYQRLLEAVAAHEEFQSAMLNGIQKGYLNIDERLTRIWNDQMRLMEERIAKARAIAGIVIRDYILSEEIDEIHHANAQRNMALAAHRRSLVKAGVLVPVPVAQGA